MAETIVWIDPDNVSTTLHGVGVSSFVAWNVSGRYSPPTQFDEERVPEQSGTRLRAVRHDARDVAVPLWVVGSDEPDLRTQLRDLAWALNPLRGDGRLRITSPLGDEREIVCRVQSGLEGAERIGDSTGDAAQLLPLVVRAFDPYWQAVSDSSVSFETGETANFFPFFPLRLSSSEVFATGSVTNSGDVNTWPVWTITGPGSAIVLRNQTTGKSLTLSTTVGVGESVVIDTRGGVKTVRDNDDANLFSSLSATSSLWPLQRGVNALQIEMSSATSDSLVTLAYRPRYLMA